MCISLRHQLLIHCCTVHKDTDLKHTIITAEEFALNSKTFNYIAIVQINATNHATVCTDFPDAISLL